MGGPLETGLVAVGGTLVGMAAGHLGARFRLRRRPPPVVVELDPETAAWAANLVAHMEAGTLHRYRSTRTTYTD